MKDEQMTLTRLTGGIYRSTMAYTNEVLGKYNLGSGTYPYLLMLCNKEGINQNQISKELDVDKAMSARAVKKLVAAGYIKKVSDLEDSRAFQLYLTEKAKIVIPEIISELKKWNDIITRSLSEKEKDEILELLGIVLKDAKYRTNTEKN